MTVEDLRGEPVVVGDTIAYAAHDGRSAGMRVGKVIEIVEAGRRFSKYLKAYRDVPTMLRVQVEYTNRDDTHRNGSRIQADMKRFVKVTP